MNIWSAAGPGIPIREGMVVAVEFPARPLAEGRAPRLPQGRVRLAANEGRRFDMNPNGFFLNSGIG